MASAEKQQCTNCKCWRVLLDFIGARGAPVKRCKKCRDKDDAKKKKEHVREKTNARQREKKYYQVYREKKRKEDEEAYLAHNARVMKDWRDSNSEHVAQWRKSNANYMLSHGKSSASKKGLVWELDDEYALDMMASPCHYCAELPTDRVNGIDRQNSALGYMTTNCVPCCKMCNMMKGCLDPTTYIERCRHIAGLVDHPDAWVDHAPATFSMYADRASRKGLTFEIDSDYYASVQGRPCSYCIRECDGGMGIDRVDNSEGYVLSNCVPCCAECNYMKRDLHGDAFVEACKKVAALGWQDTSSTFRNKYHMRRPTVA